MWFQILDRVFMLLRNYSTNEADDPNEEINLQHITHILFEYHIHTYIPI